MEQAKAFAKASRQGKPTHSPPPDEIKPAIEAWNMLGGTIDWQGLPVICELLGITDVEMLLYELMVIRNHV